MTSRKPREATIDMSYKEAKEVSEWNNNGWLIASVVLITLFVCLILFDVYQDNLKNNNYVIPKDIVHNAILEQQKGGQLIPVCVTSDNICFISIKDSQVMDLQLKRAQANNQLN